MSSPNATILLSTNGGAYVQTSAQTPQGQTVPSAATIQLKGQDITGWQQASWEIFAFPPGWAGPAGGDWSYDSVRNLYRSTLFQPSLITLPASTSVWGKWIARLIVNNGIGPGSNGLVYGSDGQPEASTMVDVSGGFQTLSPNSGLQDVGLYEGSQFGGYLQWVQALQTALRKIDGGPFGPAKAGVVSGVERLVTTTTTPAPCVGPAIYTVPANTHVDCVMTVVAKLQGSTQIWTQDYYANYYVSGGAVTLSGSVGTGGRTLPTTLTGVSATWTVVSNTLVPQVTDATGGRTINWSVAVQYQPVTD